jgi:hypothetical protein
MADLTGEGALIEQALRDLQIAWDATGESWRDAARADIDQHHLTPMRARAREAAKTLQMLSTLVHEAERACS